MYDTNDLQAVLEQIGQVNYSREHKKGYRLLPASLKGFLTLIHTPSNYRLRGKDNFDNMLNFITIDHDGDKKSFDETLSYLEFEDISYIAFPTPSHIKKLANGDYRMRIVIPTKGLTKGMYSNQFLQLYTDLGLTGDGLDGTSKEIARFFYPPVMTGAIKVRGKFVDITEPKVEDINGCWAVTDPKPRDMTLKLSKSLVEVYLGHPYEARTRFTQKMKDELTTKFSLSTRDSIYINDDEILKYRGEPLGTFKKLSSESLFNDSEHIRVDCPFHDAHTHSDGYGKGYAFVVDNRVTCGGNGHENIIGRLLSDKPMEFDNLSTLDEVLS